jgi:hypothetical protein
VRWPPVAAASACNGGSLFVKLYADGFMGDFVVGSDKVVSGFFGYIRLAKTGTKRLEKRYCAGQRNPTEDVPASSASNVLRLA